MRQHQWAILVVTGSFLMGMTSCAADSAKPSAETPPTSQITQAEEGKDQPPPGEVQERAVPRMMPGTGPLIMKPQPPPPTGGTSAGRLGPSGVAAPPPMALSPGPLNVAPTPDLTLVANALSMYTKSLTVLIRVAPKLVLSHPVYIRLDISSPGYRSTVGVGKPCPLPERCFDLYNPYSTEIWISDSEGDGQPRPVSVTITLSDDSGHSFNFGPWTVTLAPLYYVSAGGVWLKFLNNCGHQLGDGFFQVHLGWRSPDGTWQAASPVKLLPYGNPDVPVVDSVTAPLPSGVVQQPGPDGTLVLGFEQFQFQAKELSRSALQSLHMPAIGFWVGGNVAAPWVPASTVPLPHNSFSDPESIQLNIDKQLTDTSHPGPACVANSGYGIGAGLMKYYGPSAGNVRWLTIP